MDSEKLINLFEIKKNKSCIYLWDNFFRSLLITFRCYYYAKYMHFCYISKYWNFDRIKLLAESVYVKHP